MSSFAQNATIVLVHGAWADAAPVPAWKAKPSWFLLAGEDRMIAPETQCYMAKRMSAKIRTYQVDHTPMHTVPGVVVNVILEAARETRAR
jgi:hypothetical protein